MGSKFVNNLKTAVFLGLMTALILFAGQLIGGRQGLIIALFMAGIGNIAAYFFSDKIALASMGARQVGPEHPLHRIVAELIQRTQMPMPRVYVSPQMAPNAFATGRNPKNAAVCATEGLLQMLDRNEVAGVMAHELAHVKHRDILIQTVAATIGGAISMLGYMFMFGGGGRHDDEEDGGHPIAGLLVLLLGPLAASLIQMAISRSREFAADTEGAAICGNPNYLASALQKIHAGNARIPMDVNPAFQALMIAEPTNLMGKVAHLFSTHPPLEARLRNLLGDQRTVRRPGFAM
jgi:heat shock protein HtpX